MLWKATFHPAGEARMALEAQQCSIIMHSHGRSHDSRWTGLAVGLGKYQGIIP